MTTLTRRKTLSDGTKIIQKPHRYPNGTFQVVIEVTNEAEAEAWFRSGKAVAMRMSGSDGQVNVCKPDQFND